MTRRISILGFGLTLMLFAALMGTSCGGGSAPSTTTHSILPTTTLPTTTPPPTTTVPPTTTLPPTTTQASFPYQGSGSGTWSGQIIYNSTTYNIDGTMTIAVDSHGVFSGTVFSSSGGAANTNITAQVDSNGNLTGTVSFVVNSTTFVTQWQGKMTVSGTVLSMQGTWTSTYGSGTFSGSGISSK